MRRFTLEQNDALRQTLWGNFRAHPDDLVARTGPGALTAKEARAIQEQLGRHLPAGQPDIMPLDEPPEPTGEVPLRDRLIPINSETVAVSITTAAPADPVVSTTSPLPWPSRIAALHIEIQPGDDYHSFMATLVPNELNAMPAPDIQGTPLIDARHVADFAGAMGRYPLTTSGLGTTRRQMTLPCNRLVEQAGQRIAFWVDTGGSEVIATLYAVVETFDPTVRPADILRAALPRRPAWQLPDDVVARTREARSILQEATAIRQRTLSAGRPINYIQNITYRGGGVPGISQIRLSSPSQPTTPTPSVPRAMKIRVLQSGKVLFERTVAWSALAPFLKNAFLDNQASGKSDPTMIPVW